MTANAGAKGHAPAVAIQPAEPPALVMQVGDKWDKSVMRVNNLAAHIEQNIRINIRRQLPQLSPCQAQRQVLCVVGGGWSLDEPDVFEELRTLYFDGAKIVALNGAARWLMERNLRPSMHLVLDSRPENVEFVRDPVPHCRYVLASQCHPSLFDVVRDRDVTIFHVHNDDPSEGERDPVNAMLDEFYNGRWTKIPTAGTIGTVAPMLLRVLGFQFLHLFGIDSCYAPSGDRHHAYPQPMNDGEGFADFSSNGRAFRCSAWQASQAQMFMEMLSVYGDQMHIAVHGDGLIAHMINEAAQESAAKEA